jgi:hypothetical protein
VCGVFNGFPTIFQGNFTPHQHLSVGESLVLFKGSLNYKQYMNTKRHRFGIKLYLLCDNETRYVQVYTGKDTEFMLKIGMPVLDCPDSKQTKDQFLWYIMEQQKRYAPLSQKLLPGEIQPVTSNSFMVM